MANYLLTVECSHPWPTLETYNGLTRKRKDAAVLLLYGAVWQALHGMSLLDRPIALELRQWVQEVETCFLERPSTVTSKTIQMSGVTFKFTLARES